MEIVTTEIKSGRKVAKIQFKILDREPKKYFKNLEAINSPIEISDVLLKDEIKPKDIVETSLTKKIGIENVLHIENKAVIKMINNKFKDYDEAQLLGMKQSKSKG
nr:putative replication initiator protein [Clostridium sp. K25]